jgi:hypothetical protein
MNVTRRSLGACLCVAALSVASHPVRAEIRNYEFQVTDPLVRQGDSEIALRLVEKQSGKLVPEAVIFSTRLDMAPDGMETMTAPVELLPSTEPGIYRFGLTTSMEGGWRLSVRAKIQGETGTLESAVTIRVEP